MSQNTILALIFDLCQRLWQGLQGYLTSGKDYKDKSCPCKEKQGTRIRFHPWNSCFGSAPGAHPLLLLGAAKTENMLAWNHSAVDQDWFQALVAAVDHRVHHLLSNQVHLQQDALCRCAFVKGS